jgi:hypothetical protein
MRFPLATPLVTSAEGMFGAERKHDIHTGIDLYTIRNSPVFAMEDATVVAIEEFTGPPESPWWLPTKAVLAEGRSGTILYGELNPTVQVGDQIKEDQIIGHVLPVLPENKVRSDIPGHSRCMLHLELYEKGTTKSTIWKLGEPCPEGLKDPTALLYKSYSWTFGETSKEIRAIKSFYDGKVAKRSGLPYMRHISMGLMLLKTLTNDKDVWRAWAVHPIFQMDDLLSEALKKGLHHIVSNTKVAVLAMEYRLVANNYLTKDLWLWDKKEPKLSKIPEVNLLLVVDKIQNWYDASRYLKTSYQEELMALDSYFANWRKALGISDQQMREYEEFLESLDAYQNKAEVDNEQ